MDMGWRRLLRVRSRSFNIGKSMVDRQKRDIAGRLLRDYWSGRIASDDLENSFPSDKGDPALATIYERRWFVWDSFHSQTYRQDQRDQIADTLFQSCIAFLRSDLEYQWPLWKSKRISFGLGFLRVLGLRKKATAMADARAKKLWGNEAVGRPTVLPTLVGFISAGREYNRITGNWRKS